MIYPFEWDNPEHVDLVRAGQGAGTCYSAPNICSSPPELGGRDCKFIARRARVPTCELTVHRRQGCPSAPQKQGRRARFQALPSAASSRATRASGRAYCRTCVGHRMMAFLPFSLSIVSN